mgnify:CR=1 FL=1
MIWMFLITNLFLLLEICISTYMISYCKKQEFDYSIFEIGLKSYLFVMIAGLIMPLLIPLFLTLVFSDIYRLTVVKMFLRLQFILLSLVS